MWQLGMCLILIFTFCDGRTIVETNAEATEMLTTTSYESTAENTATEEELILPTTEQIEPIILTTHPVQESTTPLPHSTTPLPRSTEEENVKIEEDEISSQIQSSFSCEGRVYGYYADPENECKVYHVCTNITMATGYTQLHRASFKCGPGTIFSQMHRTCVHPPIALPLDCKLAPQFYSINLDFGYIPLQVAEIPPEAQLNTFSVPGSIRPVINRITAPIREFMPFIPELKSAHPNLQPATNHPVSDVQSLTADDQTILVGY